MIISIIKPSPHFYEGILWHTSVIRSKFDKSKDNLYCVVKPRIVYIYYTLTKDSQTYTIQLCIIIFWDLPIIPVNFLNHLGHVSNGCKKMMQSQKLGNKYWEIILLYPPPFQILNIQNIHYSLQGYYLLKIFRQNNVT